MKFKSKSFTLVYIFIGLIIFWFGGFMYFSHHINHYNTRTEENTDAVVVLTGGRNRIARGVEIYNEGRAKRLFISGVSKSTTLDDLEQRIGYKIRDKHNVELGYVATTTIGNALEVKNWVEKNSINSIILVTSNYHVPRSIAELSVYNLPIKVTICPVYSDHVRMHWWKSFKTFLFIFSEYNRFLFVYVRNMFFNGDVL